MSHLPQIKLRSNCGTILQGKTTALSNSFLKLGSDFVSATAQITTKIDSKRFSETIARFKAMFLPSVTALESIRNMTVYERANSIHVHIWYVSNGL